MGNKNSTMRRKKKKQLKVDGTTVRALYSLFLNADNILNITKGDLLVVKADPNSQWLFGQNLSTSKTGFVPYNYVTLANGSPMSLEGWFDINRAESEKKLYYQGYPKGTYIIRNCSDPGVFVLSIRVLDAVTNIYGVKHYKVRPLDDGGFYINSANKFTDFQSLVEYYKKNSSGLCCCLSEPFPKVHRPPVQFRELEVNRNCLLKIKKIGNGFFGDVFLAKWNKTVEVAIKMLKENTSDLRNSFLEEAQIMHKLSHPRIVQILGVCSEPSEYPIYIITEFMANGSLKDYFLTDAGKSTPFRDLLIIIYQVSEGMAYLESKKYIHRDLRAANILVAEDQSVKVADFGLSRIIDEVYIAKSNCKFPIKWTAPEAGLQHIFSIKSDVWSFGVLVYEIVTRGIIPYAGLETTRILIEVRNGYRLPNPECSTIECPRELYSIMLSCWDIYPTKRPTFECLKTIFEEFSISTEPHYEIQ